MSGCLRPFALNGRNESALRERTHSPHAPTARTARPRGDSTLRTDKFVFFISFSGP